MVSACRRCRSAVLSGFRKLKPPARTVFSGPDRRVPPSARMPPCPRHRVPRSAQKPTTAKSTPCVLSLRCPGRVFGLLGRMGAGRPPPSKFFEGCSLTYLRRGHHPRPNLEDACAQLTGTTGHLPAGDSPLRKTHGARNHRTFASFYREPRPGDEVSTSCSSLRKPDSWSANFPADNASAWPWPRSGGQSEILFLDEPTLASTRSRRQLWGHHPRLSASRRDGLLTTHYMDEAERLCDRLAIVDHGGIIAEGSPPISSPPGRPSCVSSV